MTSLAIGTPVVVTECDSRPELEGIKGIVVGVGPLLKANPLFRRSVVKLPGLEAHLSMNPFNLRHVPCNDDSSSEDEEPLSNRVVAKKRKLLGGATEDRKLVLLSGASGQRSSVASGENSAGDDERDETARVARKTAHELLRKTKEELAKARMERLPKLLQMLRNGTEPERKRAKGLIDKMYTPEQIKACDAVPTTDPIDHQSSCWSNTDDAYIKKHGRPTCFDVSGFTIVPRWFTKLANLACTYGKMLFDCLGMTITTGVKPVSVHLQKWSVEGEERMKVVVNVHSTKQVVRLVEIMLEFIYSDLISEYPSTRQWCNAKGKFNAWAKGYMIGFKDVLTELKNLDTFHTTVADLSLVLVADNVTRARVETDLDTYQQRCSKRKARSSKAMVDHTAMSSGVAAGKLAATNFKAANKQEKG